jgi:hypothetical protein
MPALCRASMSSLMEEIADGRDEPGHDEKKRQRGDDNA